MLKADIAADGPRLTMKETPIAEDTLPLLS